MFVYFLFEPPSAFYLVVNLHSIDGISDRWQLVIAMGKLVEVVV
jgi:hypothetical protein